MRVIPGGARRWIGRSKGMLKLVVPQERDIFLPTRRGRSRSTCAPSASVRLITVIDPRRQWEHPVNIFPPELPTVLGSFRILRSEIRERPFLFCRIIPFFSATLNDSVRSSKIGELRTVATKVHA